ncbi:MAG: hypothetical protein ACRD5H_13650, partial [Nitrososphaerales archaeon]
IVDSGLAAGTYSNTADASGEHQAGTVEDTSAASCDIFRPREVPGYTTGGGRVIAPASASDESGGKTFTVRHGFELHCSTAQVPNQIEVNWLKHSFHLERVDSVTCEDNFPVTKSPPQPPAPPTDTYIGTGTGRLDGVCGATIDFILNDQGEPGKNDQIVRMIITDSGGNIVLEITDPLNLKVGNHQWPPHPATHKNTDGTFGPCTGEI